MAIVKLDTETANLLSRLKDQLHEPRDEGVVRKALALLGQVVEVAGEQRYFTLLTPTGRTIRINLD